MKEKIKHGFHIPFKEPQKVLINLPHKSKRYKQHINSNEKGTISEPLVECPINYALNGMSMSNYFFNYLPGVQIGSQPLICHFQ